MSGTRPAGASVQGEPLTTEGASPETVAGWLRVPERLLHFLAFAGGTPFALLAQQLLRHKTVKRSFRVVFWVVAVAQVVLIVLAVLYFSRSS